VKGSLDDILARTEDVDGVSLIVSSIPDSDMGQLRQLSDLVRQKVGSSYIIVLGGYTESSGSLLIAVSDDLVSRGIRADELIKPVAQLINGSGGGRPQMAQAGSKHPSRVPEALDECGTIIKGQLTR
jgi:alanyl-tRNA synthetase